MGMLLGGQGLHRWRDGWMALPCPLERIDLLAASGADVSAVDNGAHRLWHGGRVLPCDRDVEALALWQGHALLLSGDTDCLAIADGEGWLHTARVGVFPQGMCIAGDVAHVCGGVDGRIHLLALPGLQEVGTCAVPGLPECIAVQGNAAWVLCFRPEDEGRTELLRLDLRTGQSASVMHFPGLPGAIRVDAEGLWAAVTDRLYHFPPGASSPDGVIGGFPLVRHIDVQGGTALVTDPTEGLAAQVRGTSVQVVHRGAVGQAVYGEKEKGIVNSE